MSNHLKHKALASAAGLSLVLVSSLATWPGLEKSAYARQLPAEVDNAPREASANAAESPAEPSSSLPAATKGGPKPKAQAADEAGRGSTRDERNEAEKRPSFINDKRWNGFLDSLSSTSRETGKGGADASRSLKTVLDLRLPLIDEKCDITVSHELIKLGYAYYAKIPGAEAEIRSTADALVKKKDLDYRGVTPKCRAALKGFGIAVLRVYLGADWSVEDERRLDKAVLGDDLPPQPVPNRDLPAQ